MLTLTLPLKLMSEGNQREHWGAKARRTKLHRAMVFTALRAALWPAPPLPLVVTLTRIAPRSLDDDNASGSCKYVRDGVADWLGGQYGKGQDRQPGLTWRYAQRKGKPREYAVEILIENNNQEQI